MVLFVVFYFELIWYIYIYGVLVSVMSTNMNSTVLYNFKFTFKRAQSYLMPERAKHVSF